ncbi:ESX secretion-associated protein EspG [Actinophytocola sp.]|uniref:ESX secretion-associated protein EspG n=1 Tax=Actinophytocola sp. TaxID=1872138 RepID=UPI002ED424FF
MAGFRLSLPEVDVLAQTLDVNVRQFPLQIPSFGEYQQDRVRMAREVFLGLDRRGLIRGGDLDPQLTRALRTLSDYVVTVAVMGTVEKTKKLYARAAAAGETGVLAVKEGESLRLELIRPTALAITLVGLLPPMSAGPGQSVTITQPGSRQHQESEGTLLAPVYANRTAGEQQMRIAAGYLSRPRTGTGMFTVSGRDRRIGRERQGGHVTWIDTDAGRYLAVVRPPGDDGLVRSTFSPADANRMAQQIGELISAVAP